MSKTEIEHVLRTMVLRIPDPDPRETRYRTAGQTPLGRHVFVVFTYRELGGGTLIRPVSARYMKRRWQPMSTSKKSWPTLTSDEMAEKFVAEADLSDFDWSAAEPVHHEFADKSARVNMRMPESQLEAIKAEAKKRGVKYQRFMRELLDRGMQTLR